MNIHLPGKRSGLGLFNFHIRKLLWMFIVAMLTIDVAMPAAPTDMATPATPAGVAIPARPAEENNAYLLFKALQPVNVNAKWKEECSACHIAFPPGLLQAESWIKIMQELDEHFGVNASLTASENKEIAEFLVNNASTRWRSLKAPSRISEAAWFKKNHSLHEGAWKDPKVKSASNCLACHKNSDHGDFYGAGGGCGGASNCHTFKHLFTR